MAQKKRAPGHNIINEFLPVFRENMTAFALTDEQRIGLYAVAGPDWAVDAPRDESLGPGKKFC
jgi:hypothetical protein